MDGCVWRCYLREVLGSDIDKPSVIVLDNFESHVKEEGYRIVQEKHGSHLCAIPPNTTAVCQPLDVGIMAPFERHLRDLWLLEDEIEGDDDDLDDADIESPTSRMKRMSMVNRTILAWDKISDEDVRKAFRKAIPRSITNE
ncbi:hypothetical protein LEN26_001591 [Aphanomyces euteiches]|nr:hypothetical protein AeMF1_013862 [Aphanomyces euteiches]KAH9134595.1 hypothetical protein AeRB84_019694 [Aphanomyces euteiches]KAH9161061.1 hypothetical protein LEN26_001591 [Aphanomyces euteiches]KAH9191824.1 hypothetical protein AeNC1_006198 [Aphanomyces euteiches]